MPALSVVLPLTLAAVVIASGIAKLRRPDDLQGWAELGVPAAFRRAWLVRVHPWGELALGVALALLGGILGLVAAIVATVLMAAYLWLVARARRVTPDASCSCFGERRRITVVTVVRNAWLTAVAVAAASVIWTTPLWGGALLTGTADLGWLVGLVVAAVTVGVILWPETGADAATPLPAASGADLTAVGSAEDLDYVRTRTPAVPVTLADGTSLTLRQLASSKPQLLLSVSPGCGSCTSVMEKVPAWRTELPELEVRYIVRATPETSTLVEHEQPLSLHDPDGYVSESFGYSITPTAVLLGIDGMLAGGPVSGPTAVEEFVADIRASLDDVATGQQGAQTAPRS